MDGVGAHTPTCSCAAECGAGEREREDEVKVCKEVREHNLVRREHAAARLAAVTPLALPPLLPSSRCLGDVVMGVLRTTLAAKAR